MGGIKALDDMRNAVETVAADCDEEWILDCLDAIDVEVSARYMKLPEDMDGESIHVGDKVQQINHAGEWTKALPVISVDERGCFVTVQALAGTARTYVWGNNCRHVKPRTIEDVITSAMQYAYLDREESEWDAKIAELADEIRKITGGEE